MIISDGIKRVSGEQETWCTGVSQLAVQFGLGFLFARPEFGCC